MKKLKENKRYKLYFCHVLFLVYYGYLFCFDVFIHDDYKNSTKVIVLNHILHKEIK